MRRAAATVDTATVAAGWWKVAGLRLPAAVAVLFLAACSSQEFCTTASCLSQLRVHLDLPAAVRGPVDVQVCVHQRCEPTVTVPSPELPAFVDTLQVVSQSHTSLTVRATQHGRLVGVGSADVHLHRLAPNGTRCGPVCYRGTVRLRPHTLDQPSERQ
jgi:hypothetical protein